MFSVLGRALRTSRLKSTAVFRCNLVGRSLHLQLRPDRFRKDVHGFNGGGSLRLLTTHLRATEEEEASKQKAKDKQEQKLARKASMKQLDPGAKEMNKELIRCLHTKDFDGAMKL